MTRFDCQQKPKEPAETDSETNSTTTQPKR